MALGHSRCVTQCGAGWDSLHEKKVRVCVTVTGATVRRPGMDSRRAPVPPVPKWSSRSPEKTNCWLSEICNHGVQPVQVTLVVAHTPRRLAQKWWNWWCSRRRSGTGPCPRSRWTWAWARGAAPRPTSAAATATRPLRTSSATTLRPSPTRKSANATSARDATPTRNRSWSDTVSFYIISCYNNTVLFFHLFAAREISLFLLMLFFLIPVSSFLGQYRWVFFVGVEKIVCQGRFLLGAARLCRRVVKLKFNAARREREDVRMGFIALKLFAPPAFSLIGPESSHRKTFSATLPAGDEIFSSAACKTVKNFAYPLARQVLRL